jgi:hypothetical protein
VDHICWQSWMVWFPTCDSPHFILFHITHELSSDFQSISQNMTMKNWTQLQKKLMKSWMTKNLNNLDLLNPTRSDLQISAYLPQHCPINNITFYISIPFRVLASALIHFILGFNQQIRIVSKCLFSSRVSASISDASKKVNKERRKRSTVTI